MDYSQYIQNAQQHIAAILEKQFARIEKMKAETAFTDYSKLSTIKIGIVGGDGIGPFITAQAKRVLEYLLADEIKSGKVQLIDIEGLTIENRVACGKAIPDDVLAELKKCDVLLKGPTTTPQAGDPWPNIESANVAMRKELDLFANVRPVSIPDQGIDWVFFRENTEGCIRTGKSGLNSKRRPGALTSQSLHTRAPTESSKLLLTTHARPAETKLLSSQRQTSSKPQTASSWQLLERLQRITPKWSGMSGISIS